MDLRPKMAAEIVEALLADIRLDLPPERKARMVELALSKIVSHSIPLGGVNSYGSDDPAVIEQFFEKYPKLRQIVADTVAKAKEIWPDADLLLELNNDPEGCHTCWEGQSLRLGILRHQEFLEDDPKADAFDDWWMDYAYGDNRIPEFNLFLAMPGYAPEESS